MTWHVGIETPGLGPKDWIPRPEVLMFEIDNAIFCNPRVTESFYRQKCVLIGHTENEIFAIRVTNQDDWFISCVWCWEKMAYVVEAGSSHHKAKFSTYRELSEYISAHEELASA